MRYYITIILKEKKRHTLKIIQMEEDCLNYRVGIRQELKKAFKIKAFLMALYNFE